MTDSPAMRSVLLSVAALGFPWVAKRLADHQEYLVRAHTIGASKEDAERVLGEVMAELATTGAPGDAHTIAYRRLLDLTCGNARPPEQVRDAARQALRCEGSAVDPESVDRHARWLTDYLERRGREARLPHD